MGANYLSFKDVPVYFSTSANNGTTTTPTEAANDAVFATQFQLNAASNIAPTRIVGKQPQKDDFLLAGPPNTTFSFSAFAKDALEFNPADFTGDVGNIGASVRVGNDGDGIKLSGCFMTNFSFTLTPYAPVQYSCDFISYNPVGTTASSTNHGNQKLVAADSASTVPTLKMGDFGHGAYSDVNGLSILTGLGTIESLQYNYSINRQPLYAIGTEFVTGTEVISEEVSVVVNGDNIMPIVRLTGVNPGNITGAIRNSDLDFCLGFAIDGRITANNVTIAGGDLARGSVTIQELLK